MNTIQLIFKLAIFLNQVLTTIADLTWSNQSNNRYRIKSCASDSKARAMFLINNNTESQVTFLQNARFLITEVNAWGDGMKEIIMYEQ